MKKKSTQGTRSSKKKTEPVLNVLSPLHPDNPDYKKSQETEITIYEREKDELVIKLLAELRSKNFTRRQMQDIYNTIRFLDGRSVQEGMDLINVSTLHTRYDIKLHFVWITKCRRPILTEEVAIRVRELVREICLANEVQILKGHISRGLSDMLRSAIDEYWEKSERKAKK